MHSATAWERRERGPKLQQFKGFCECPSMRTSRTTATRSLNTAHVSTDAQGTLISFVLRSQMPTVLHTFARSVPSPVALVDLHCSWLRRCSRVSGMEARVLRRGDGCAVRRRFWRVKQKQRRVVFVRRRVGLCAVRTIFSDFPRTFSPKAEGALPARPRRS